MKLTEQGYAVLENDSHISRWQIESGRLDHDLTVQDHILPLLKPDYWIVDAGAFNGDHTLRYAQAVPDGLVLAYEPNPEAFECLLHNTKHCLNVRPFNAALSDRREFCKFLRDTNAGGSHLVREDGEALCKPLDEYVIERLDFFKLDVEGYELFALKGAERTIRRCKPTILVEMNAGTLARNGVKYQDIFEFLAGLGYKWESFAQNVDLLNEPQYDLLARPK